MSIVPAPLSDDVTHHSNAPGTMGIVPFVPDMGSLPCDIY